MDAFEVDWILLLRLMLSGWTIVTSSASSSSVSLSTLPSTDPDYAYFVSMANETAMTAFITQMMTRNNRTMHASEWRRRIQRRRCAYFFSVERDSKRPRKNDSERAMFIDIKQCTKTEMHVTIETCHMPGALDHVVVTAHAVTLKLPWPSALIPFEAPAPSGQSRPASTRQSRASCRQTRHADPAE